MGWSAENKEQTHSCKRAKGDNMDKIVKEFDGVKEIVYVIDADSQELLFINQAGLKAFGYKTRDEVIGKKCYQVLQGIATPCAYCNRNALSREFYTEWEQRNEITGRKYQMKGRMTEWEEREACFVIADDCSNMDLQETDRNKRQEQERIAMECIKMMHSSAEIEVAINNTLEILGTYLNGERTYIFRVHGEYMDNSYEWCAEGVTSEIDHLQHMPITLLDRWLPHFDQNECVIIKDLEEVKDSSPEEYAVLKAQNIHSLITVPMMDKEKLTGYFGIDNPQAENLEDVSNILKILAYFFQSLLERKMREDYLKKISFTDGMTGAWNRNAFIRDTMTEDNKGLFSIGVCYVDINGLKRMNDTKGHEAGDALIRQTYQVIHSVAEQYPVYRLGGDEFIVLCRNVSREKLDLLEIRLKQELDGRNHCSAAVGASFLENPGDLTKLIEEADQRMYQDKLGHYGKEK